MTDASRVQGGLICAGVVVLGALFLAGLVSQSYWAVALPVAVLVCFVLGLAFWVGWTIATVRVEPEEEVGSDSSASGPQASDSAPRASTP